MARAYNPSPPKVEAGRSEVQGHRPVGRETSLRNYHLPSQYISKRTKQSRFSWGDPREKGPGRQTSTPKRPRDGAQFRKPPRATPLCACADRTEGPNHLPTPARTAFRSLTRVQVAGAHGPGGCRPAAPPTSPTGETISCEGERDGAGDGRHRTRKLRTGSARHSG